jgi:hypothetical protein
VSFLFFRFSILKGFYLNVSAGAGGCFSNCGILGSRCAHLGEDDIQIKASIFTSSCLSKVPARTIKICEVVNMFLQYCTSNQSDMLGAQAYSNLRVILPQFSVNNLRVKLTVNGLVSPSGTTLTSKRISSSLVWRNLAM